MDILHHIVAFAQFDMFSFLLLFVRMEFNKYLFLILIYIFNHAIFGVCQIGMPVHSQCHGDVQLIELLE